MASFAEVFLKSLPWRPVKTAGRKRKPHPSESHLVNEYQEQSLKETMCCTAQPSASFKNYIDDDIEGGMSTSADTSKAQMASFAEAFLKSLPWRPVKTAGRKRKPHPSDSHLVNEYQEQSLKETMCCTYPNLKNQFHMKGIGYYPLCIHLNDVYSKSHPFLKCVFGQKRKPSKWDINMQMFLFAINALCSRSTKREFALRSVAGCTDNQLRKLKPGPILRAIPDIVPTNGSKSAKLLIKVKTDDTLPRAIQDLVPANDSERGELLIETKSPAAFLIGIQDIVPSNNSESGDSGISWIEEANEPEVAVDLLPEETMHKEDKLVVEIFCKRLAMDKNDKSSIINELCHLITSKTLEESKTSQEQISKLSFKNTKNRVIEKHYALLSQPAKDFTALTQSAKNQKANHMKNIVACLVGSDIAQQQALLELVYRKFEDLILLHKEDFKWT
ncbi:unnamed protein product [Cylindrotheca closterium]|uniref:Uncharacterized protein n=1 Tax=Cylindrotheca closterium TaxID=2856 RepID=A0AAD2FJR4_9STRA|nr:unnamed protein product [Cylindrotheca closterium]